MKKRKYLPLKKKIFPQGGRRHPYYLNVRGSIFEVRNATIEQREKLYRLLKQIGDTSIGSKLIDQADTLSFIFGEKNGDGHEKASYDSYRIYLPNEVMFPVLIHELFHHFQYKNGRLFINEHSTSYLELLNEAIQKDPKNWQDQLLSIREFYLLRMIAEAEATAYSYEITRQIYEKRGVSFGRVSLPMLHHNSKYCFRLLGIPSIDPEFLSYVYKYNKISQRLEMKADKTVRLDKLFYAREVCGFFVMRCMVKRAKSEIYPFLKDHKEYVSWFSKYHESCLKAATSFYSLKEGFRPFRLCHQERQEYLFSLVLNRFSEYLSAKSVLALKSLKLSADQLRDVRCLEETYLDKREKIGGLLATNSLKLQRLCTDQRTKHVLNEFSQNTRVREQ